MSEPAVAEAPAAPRWHEVLSREEIESLLEMQDWRSWWTLAVNWGMVFGCMAAVAWWPHAWTLPLVVVAALFGIGSRQLGMAVVMHDAAHRSFLRNRAVNDWVGSWLAAYPTWASIASYRPYHLRHHAHNWTEADPDIGLARPFPITRRSLWRKIGRDLSGRTGLKFARFGLKRDLGIGATGPRSPEEIGAGRRRFSGMLACNAVLFAICAVFLHPAVYLLWPAAWLTTNTLVTRIRSIAEHSMPGDPADPLRNTRTIVPPTWQRAIFAPCGVNYHLEHHLLMTVPHYHLPRMHALLTERGVLDRALVGDSYLTLLRQASSRPATA